jgi:hypothetical protein
LIQKKVPVIALFFIIFDFDLEKKKLLLVLALASLLVGHMPIWSKCQCHIQIPKSLACGLAWLG